MPRYHGGRLQGRDLWCAQFKTWVMPFRPCFTEQDMKNDIDILTFLVPVISAKAEIFESLLFQPNYSTRKAMVKKSKKVEIFVFCFGPI